MKTGDAIHAFANPIAKGIDAIWGSDLANCSGCSKMRDNLNAGMSFWEAVKQRISATADKKGELQMQFQIQTVVEAESVQEALAKLGEGTVISVTPRPQQPAARPVGIPQPNLPQGMMKVGP